MKQQRLEWIDRAKRELSKLGISSLFQGLNLQYNDNTYFPAVNYPPVNMYAQMQESEVFDYFPTRSPNPLIGYLHIPFCRSSCTHCNRVTKNNVNEYEIDLYIEYLEKEMMLYKKRVGMDKVPLASVLWGGGTPTYLSPIQLDTLISAYQRHYELADCTQFSVKAEPTTLVGDEGMARLRVMKELGVDRVSLGVQSFDNNVLRSMGCAHTHTQVMQAIENIKIAGFDNIYIDLVYGYPGQTIEKWAEELLHAMFLNIEGLHLRCLRPREVFDKRVMIEDRLDNISNIVPRTNEIVLMKYLGIIISEEYGFLEYQRHVFSKQKNTSSHYIRDWYFKLYDVAGLGVSAYSLLRDIFSINVADTDLSRYYHYLDEEKMPVNRGKVLTFDDIARRSFVLPLINEHVDKAVYKSFVGEEATVLFESELAVMKQLDMIDEDNKKIWLTKKGSLFSTEVTARFCNPRYISAQNDINFLAAQPLGE